MPAEFRHRRHPALVLSLLALLSACSDAPDSTVAQNVASAAAATAPARAAAVDEETPAQLMRRANAAFRENRIVDRSGDNATELFLAVRDHDPNHPGLADALVEIMPLAQFAFEAAVRDQYLAEAERLHGLIARINAESAITRSAETRVADLRSTLAKTRAVSKRDAPDAVSKTTPVKSAPALPVATKPVAVAVASTPAAVPAASREFATAPAVVTTGRSSVSAPQPISKVAPDYPPQARSRKLEGFVELEFRVTANGSTEDIRVVRSEPEGLFDRNAVRALMRWKFKPAERDGVPEATTTRTTMNFRQS